MTLMNAYAQYNNSKVLTASPQELTKMLYDGAIKFCNIAQIGLEKGDDLKFTTNLVKVENIVVYLNSTLDMKYPVAKDFENVYNLILGLCVDADLHREYAEENMAKVNKFLHTMRDTWVQAMAMSKASA